MTPSTPKHKEYRVGEVIHLSDQNGPRIDIDSNVRAAIATAAAKEQAAITRAEVLAEVDAAAESDEAGSDSETPHWELPYEVECLWLGVQALWRPLDILERPGEVRMCWAMEFEQWPRGVDPDDPDAPKDPPLGGRFSITSTDFPKHPFEVGDSVILSLRPGPDPAALLQAAKTQEGK